MKLIFVIIFVNLILVQFSYAAEECVSPWQKVNDDICLFLDSLLKPWDQAKFLCNFYGADLLFINNPTEQRTIQRYLARTVKHRYNKKPNIWLDSTDQLNDGNWIWSKDNKTLNFTNWITGYSGIDFSARGLHCGCLRLRDGLWKGCDCASKQHFVCRKSDKPLNLQVFKNNFDTSDIEGLIELKTNKTLSENPQQDSADSMPNNKVIEETPDMSVSNNDKKTHSNGEAHHPKNLFNMTISIEEEENKRTIVAKFFMDNEDKMPKNFSSELDQTKKLSKKSSFSILRMKEKPSANEPVSIREDTVEKTEKAYSYYYCPNGLGYYSIIGTECSKYKICEDLDSKNVVVTVYECPQNGIFNFDSRTCVARTADSTCDSYKDYFETL